MKHQPQYAIAIIEQGKTINEGLVALFPLKNDKAAANKAYEETEVTPSYYKILSVTEFKYKDENFRGPDHEGDYFPSVLKSSNRLFTN